MAIPRNDWCDAEELAKKEMNRLRGRLCSLVEAMDVDGREEPITESQEEAVIALLKQFTYDTQEVLSQVFAHIDSRTLEFRYTDNRLEVR